MQSHQFSLFEHRVMRPSGKVPISAARIQEAKKLLSDGDYRSAADALRHVREGLERYEARITNGRG